MSLLHAEFAHHQRLRILDHLKVRKMADIMEVVETVHHAALFLAEYLRLFQQHFLDFLSGKAQLVHEGQAHHVPVVAGQDDQLGLFDDDFPHFFPRQPEEALEFPESFVRVFDVPGEGLRGADDDLTDGVAGEFLGFKVGNAGLQVADALLEDAWMPAHHEVDVVVGQTHFSHPIDPGLRTKQVYEEQKTNEM